MRLFIALWPDETVRQKLADLPLDGGRRVLPANLHMTLAFLGEQAEAVVPALHGILNDLAPQNITLNIDHLDHFVTRDETILWAGPSSPPAALQDLQAVLQADLRKRGFKTTDHAHFIPHITLARRASRAALTNLPGMLGSAIPWIAQKPVLVHSQSTPAGQRYRVLTSSVNAAL